MEDPRSVSDGATHMYQPLRLTRGTAARYPHRRGWAGRGRVGMDEPGRFERSMRESTPGTTPLAEPRPQCRTEVAPRPAAHVWPGLRSSPRERCDQAGAGGTVTRVRHVRPRLLVAHESGRRRVHPADVSAGRAAAFRALRPRVSARRAHLAPDRRERHGAATGSARDDGGHPRQPQRERGHPQDARAVSVRPGAVPDCLCGTAAPRADAGTSRTRWPVPPCSRLSGCGSGSACCNRSAASIPM